MNPGLIAAVAASAAGALRVASPPPSEGGFLTWTASVDPVDGYFVHWDSISGPPYRNGGSYSTPNAPHDAGSATSVASASDISGLGTGTRYFNIQSYQIGSGDVKIPGDWAGEITVVVS